MEVAQFLRYAHCLRHTPPDNKYPALVSEGNEANVPDGMYDRMDGVGSHEVVIETPFHDRQIDLMFANEAELWNIIHHFEKMQSAFLWL